MHFMEQAKLKNLGPILEAINQQEFFKAIRLVSEQTTSALIKEELVILKRTFHLFRKKRMISQEDKRTLRRIQEALLAILLEIEDGDRRIYLTSKELAREQKETVRKIHRYIQNNLSNLCNRLDWAFSMRNTARLAYFLNSTVENFFLSRWWLEKWLKQMKVASADNRNNEVSQAFLEVIKSYYLTSLEMKLQLSVLAGNLEKKESHYKYRNLNGRFNYIYQHIRLYFDSLFTRKKRFVKFKRFLRIINELEKESIRELHQVVPEYRTRLAEIFQEVDKLKTTIVR